jgi:hypothetical protein
VPFTEKLSNDVVSRSVRPVEVLPYILGSNYLDTERNRPSLAFEATGPHGALHPVSGPIAGAHRRRIGTSSLWTTFRTGGIFLASELIQQDRQPI